MTESMTTLLIILSEVVIVLLSIVIIFLVIKIRLNKNQKSEAKKLVKRIKQNEVAHKEKLLGILKNDYGLDDSLAEETLKNLIEKENSLFSRIIKLYLGDSETDLTSIDDEVKNLTRGISEMAVTDGSTKTVVKKQDISSYERKIADLEQELEKERKDKEKVREELSTTKKTMEGMMTEYASMYAGGVKEGDIKVRDEMEKLKGREWDEKNTDEAKDIDLKEDVPDLDISKDSDKTD